MVFLTKGTRPQSVRSTPFLLAFASAPLAPSHAPTFRDFLAPAAPPGDLPPRPAMQGQHYVPSPGAPTFAMEGAPVRGNELPQQQAQFTSRGWPARPHGFHAEVCSLVVAVPRLLKLNTLVAFRFVPHPQTQATATTGGVQGAYLANFHVRQ